MKLSIIIVHYNVAKLLRNCLISIQKLVQNVPYEILVIDNASTDKSWENLQAEFPEVTFITSAENVGFAKANNRAAKMAKGDYLLLLNPDTEIEKNDFSEILKFADAIENLGCLGVRMHDKKGNFLPESKRSVPDMFNSFEKLFTKKNNQSKSYYRNDVGEYDIAEVDVITGAFLLIKKDRYLQIGGLDEAYFMYGEDIDLCYTLLQNNYQNFYYGKSSILHHKGESTMKNEVYLQRFYGAMQIFVNKYYKKDHFLQYLLLTIGLKLRYFLAKLQLQKNGSKN